MKAFCSRLLLLVLPFFLLSCADNSSTSYASTPPNGPAPDTIIINRDTSHSPNPASPYPPAPPSFNKIFHDQAQIEKLYLDMWTLAPISDKNSCYSGDDISIIYRITFKYKGSIIRQISAEYESCSFVIFSPTDYRYGSQIFWDDIYAIIKIPLGF
jgi:hypothetical protein